MFYKWSPLQEHQDYWLDCNINVISICFGLCCHWGHCCFTSVSCLCSQLPIFLCKIFRLFCIICTIKGRHIIFFGQVCLYQHFLHGIPDELCLRDKGYRDINTNQRHTLFYLFTISNDTKVMTQWPCDLYAKNSQSGFCSHRGHSCFIKTSCFVVNISTFIMTFESWENEFSIFH